MNRVAQFSAIVFLAFISGACAGDLHPVPEASTHVDLASVVNAGVVRPVDGITSAGQPDEAGFGVFAKSGYVAVIDMRGPNENRGLDEANVVKDLDMQYIAFPVSGADAVSYENARKLDEVLAELNGPVLLHCGSGNRVGALLALRESLAGADDDQALEYGKSAGLTGLTPVVKKRLAEQ